MPSHAAVQPGCIPTPPSDAQVPCGTQSNIESVVRLFKDLGTDALNDLMRSATVRRFAKGRTIVRAGEPGTSLFLLKTGLLDYYRVTPQGKQVLIIRLSPGDTFGLGTLLDKPIGYLATAETLQETELYTWEHSWVRRFVAKHPTLAENALRISLEHIRLYSDRHLALVSDNVEHRLARTLAQLGARTGRHRPGGLEIQTTNEQLAELADIGFFTVSRLLNKWERKGALEKSRGKIIVKCPEKMLAGAA